MTHKAAYACHDYEVNNLWIDVLVVVHINQNEDTVISDAITEISERGEGLTEKPPKIQSQMPILPPQCGHLYNMPIHELL